MRKQVIAIATGLALGTATMMTAAIAAPHGGGGGGGHGGGFGGGGHAAFGGGHGFAAPGGGFAGSHGNFAVNRGAMPNAPIGRGNFAANNWHGNWHGGHYGRFYGPGVGVYAFGGYGPDYYDYSGAYDDGCYQRQLVGTPYGAQWQLVDVCQY